MTNESNAKNIRNAMVGIVVVVLLGLVGCSKSNDGADVPGALDLSDVVKIVDEKKALTIPDELQKVFGGLGIASIVLVDSEGRLRAFSVAGVPRPLCAASEGSRYGSQTCEQEVKSKDLTLILRSASASASDCGTCTGGGSPRKCKKSTDMRPCSTELYDCDTNCL